MRDFSLPATRCWPCSCSSRSSPRSSSACSGRTDSVPASSSGLANYAGLVQDPLFWRALGNTLVFTALVTPLSMLFGLIAAVLLNSALPARPLWRSLVILPMAVSGVATGADRHSGVRPELGRAEQSDRIPRAACHRLAVLARTRLRLDRHRHGVVAHRVEHADLPGRSAGSGTRPVRGGKVGRRERISTLPQRDGAAAGPDVVLPAGTQRHLLVPGVRSGLRSHRGGPGGATSVLVTYAYETGFVTRDQGYAASIGMVLFLFALTFAAAQWRASRTKDLVE